MKSKLLHLLDEGLSPSKIALECGIPTRDVINVIEEDIANGRLLRTDVLRTLDKDLRWQVESCKTFELRKIITFLDLIEAEYDVDELVLYLKYRPEKVRSGELYEMLSDIEKNIHSFIKNTLVKKYGASDFGWWERGVVKAVRLECVKLREECGAFNDGPYSFTTFGQLGKIIEASDQWKLFINLLPTELKDRERFKKHWEKLSHIRNQIMHPIRGEPPNLEDFDFVKTTHIWVNDMVKPK